MSVLTRFTLGQYEKMIGAGVFDGIERQRVEFIRGEIVQMTPVGNRHRAAVISITDWSYDVVDRANVQIGAQSPILIPNLGSMPEPDIAWSKHTRDYPEPCDVFLLIEVADSSLDFDLGEKRALYAEAEIRDYWVANLVEQQVDVFRQPREGVYSEHHTYRSSDKVHPLAFPNATFRPEVFSTD